MGVITTRDGEHRETEPRAEGRHSSAGKIIAAGAAATGVVVGTVAIRNALENGAGMSPERLEALGTQANPGPEDGAVVVKQFPDATVTHRRYDNSVQRYDSLDISVARAHSIETVEVGAGGVKLRYYGGKSEQLDITPLENSRQPVQITIGGQPPAMRQSEQGDGSVIFSDPDASTDRAGAGSLPTVRYDDDGRHSVAISFKNTNFAPLSATLELGSLPQQPRTLNIAADNTSLAVSGISEELLQNVTPVSPGKTRTITALYPSKEAAAAKVHPPLTVSASGKANVVLKWPENAKTPAGDPHRPIIVSAPFTGSPER